MRKLLVLGAVLAASIPTASQAQFLFGARLGFAPALGDAFKDANTGDAVKMSDGMKSQFPLQFDAAFKVTPEIAIGAYLSYGFGQVGGALADACNASGQSCSASDTRLGLEAFYTFTTANPQFLPWVGLGFGYEWGTWKATGGGFAEEALTVKGWEYLNLQVGGDFRLGPQFSLGPYVQFSIAEYKDAEVTSGGTTVSGSISKTAMHQWFGFGVRARFDI